MNMITNMNILKDLDITIDTKVSEDSRTEEIVLKANIGKRYRNDE